MANNNKIRHGQQARISGFYKLFIEPGLFLGAPNTMLAETGGIPFKKEAAADLICFSSLPHADPHHAAL
ncbi:hypothetical protein WBG83_09705 [Paenibacillus sp. y28]